jgi:Ca2+ transporting ATPase
MKLSGSPCAYIGESVSDAIALRAAEVGISMGKSGCDLTRKYAGVIVWEDNFSSIKNAVKWGRNILNNLRKFLEFQITILIVCLALVLIGSCILSRSPLNILQLIWISLIKDVLAAVAFALEAPNLLRKFHDHDKEVTSESMVGSIGV